MVMVKLIYDLNDEAFQQRIKKAEAHWTEVVLKVRQKIYDACQIIAIEQPILNIELDRLEAIKSREFNVMIELWWTQVKTKLDEAEAEAKKPDATEADKARFNDLKVQFEEAHRASLLGKRVLPVDYIGPRA
jgi:hypothetical protein